MNDRQHWASDVLVGGAIGYWVGNLLVTHQARKETPKISAIYSINRIGYLFISDLSASNAMILE